MKSMIVEDDATSRMLLEELLKSYGEVLAVDNGKDALATFIHAIATKQPFDLVCLDIMMPEMDGQKVLKEIRRQEEKFRNRHGQGCRIIMTSALCDPNSVLNAYYDLCDAYLVKPIKKKEFLEQLRKLDLIEDFTGSGDD